MSLRRNSRGRGLKLAAAVVVGVAATAVAATPAYAWPSQCSLTEITLNGNLWGAQGKCLSGTGQHRVGAVCNDGSYEYGSWTNTGTSVLRSSSVYCDTWYGTFLGARIVWQETRS